MAPEGSPSPWPGMSYSSPGLWTTTCPRRRERSAQVPTRRTVAQPGRDRPVELPGQGHEERTLFRVLREVENEVVELRGPLEVAGMARGVHRDGSPLGPE